MKLVPEMGTKVRYLKNMYGEDIDPPQILTVVDILAEQFTAVDDKGHLEFFFYIDYKEKFDAVL